MRGRPIACASTNGSTNGNRGVSRRFAFQALAAEFDKPAVSPSMEVWLHDFGATLSTGSSDTAAIGGALAFQYGNQGLFEGVALESVQACLQTSSSPLMELIGLPPAANENPFLLLA